MAATHHHAALGIGVSKTWPNGQHALQEIDCHLDYGRVTALIGANGAGKTTLLRILGGLLLPSLGSVVTLGIERPSQHPTLHRRVGYVTQRPGLDPDMTGLELLSLMATLHGVPRLERSRRVASLAQAFGITAHMQHPISTWSDGLRRRLHLACGMIHDPELLLLDEPDAGLDIEGVESIWTELTRRAHSGTAVAVITHDLTRAQCYADEVVLLHAGRIDARGTADSLIADYARPSLGVTVLGASPDRRRVEAAMRPIADVSEVRIDGNLCTIEMGDLAHTQARVLTALAALDLEISTMTVQRPDLAGVVRARIGKSVEETSSTPSPSRQHQGQRLGRGER